MKKNHKNWLEHRHRWMNAPATEATVVGDFGGQATIEYYGGLATFYREDGSYRMQLVRDQLRRTYRVTQTLGSRFYQYYIGVPSQRTRAPIPRALRKRTRFYPSATGSINASGCLWSTSAAACVKASQALPIAIARTPLPNLW